MVPSEEHLSRLEERALFGLTLVLYGIASMLSTFIPICLGLFGFAAGAGFSDIAMTTSIPATLLLLVRSMCIGIRPLKNARVA